MFSHPKIAPAGIRAQKWTFVFTIELTVVFFQMYVFVFSLCVLTLGCAPKYSSNKRKKRSHATTQDQERSRPEGGKRARFVTEQTRRMPREPKRRAGTKRMRENSRLWILRSAMIEAPEGAEAVVEAVLELEDLLKEVMEVLS